MFKKVLFITLSNIGDCILTLPVLDFLYIRFPGARITVITAERPKSIFENNPRIEKVIVYQKHAGLKENFKLFMRLKKEKFDAVIDLRNTLFGTLLSIKYKIPAFLRIPPKIMHMRDRHLYKIQKNFKFQDSKIERVSLRIKPEDEKYISSTLEQNNIKKDDKIIVVAPGARSHIKRWGRDKFSQLSEQLAQATFRIILAGDRQDNQIADYIQDNSKTGLINLCGKTSLHQLGALLKKAALLITNDSAVLHLGSYLNVPVLAVFGPTDDKKYGPWSGNCMVVKKELFCRPCQKPQCRFGTLDCMRLITVEDVLGQTQGMLIRNQPAPEIAASRPGKNDFKRILVVRTDRIGDVLLSTPVIKALRDAYPNAYIAMMVSPYAKDIAEGNPWLDEVIIYDKDARHKCWLNSMEFSCNLRRKKFGLAVILHPTNRVHLVTFFAGIPRRIGYDRKLGFLLTERIKHTKHLGEKHEVEYNLDLLRHLGIRPMNKNLFMPIKRESEEWAKDILRENGINQGDEILVIHPGASCPSKIWPNERFAEAADKLAQKYKFKVLVVAGPKDIAQAQVVIKKMRIPAVNLAGRASVAHLASILKRCRLFISNDSGPVHIASAVGAPVISIFGRAQAGLSPRRWGPLGAKDKVLHKDAGCIECLAHNCVREFACLKAITVDDVLEAADLILSSD